HQRTTFERPSSPTIHQRILGKSHTSAAHVGRPLVTCLLSSHTRGYILVKSHTNAVHVGGPSVKCLISRNTRGSILGESHITVHNVWKGLSPNRSSQEAPEDPRF